MSRIRDSQIEKIERFAIQTMADHAAMVEFKICVFGARNTEFHALHGMSSNGTDALLCIESFLVPCRPNSFDPLVAGRKALTEIVKLRSRECLRMVCEEGLLAVVSFLVAQDWVDVNGVTEPDRITPLFAASKMGHAKVVALLLRQEGVMLNRPTRAGITPLFAACEEGHTAVVSVLLGAERIYLNRPDSAGCSPLCIAARKGRTEVVSILLCKDGVDVRWETNSGLTPLLLAAAAGHDDIVSLLNVLLSS